MPEFRPGDTVRVQVRVAEGDKERLQAFQGVVIARKGSGTREMFTVRKISGGMGVERIFPLHAPVVDSIEVLRRGRVRRAKLYYLRELRGKAARIEERRDDARRGTRRGLSVPWPPRGGAEERVATIGRIWSEVVRIELIRELESTFERAGFAAVAGVDEAGRGCLAGPVVAAAVVPRPGASAARSRRLEAALGPRARPARRADPCHRPRLGGGRDPCRPRSTHRHPARDAHWR